jgi:hypothetical protein
VEFNIIDQYAYILTNNAQELTPYGPADLDSNATQTE